MSWKTFFLILLLGFFIVFITMKSFGAQKQTYRTLTRQAYIIACAETKTVKECRPMADKYVKETVK